MDFPFDTLRRWPDIDTDDLVAVDAADRLILDESVTLRADVAATDLVVIGDAFGALALAGAAALPDGTIRVHQDTLAGERALAANAARLDLTDRVRSLPLDRALVEGARVVLLRLPRSLEELRDVAALIAAHAASDVVVVAGGRLKHMTVTMNDVLAEHFGRLDVSHARQKSRVLLARDPHDGRDPAPRHAEHDGIVVCAYGGAFAGTGIDIGTRFLLDHLPDELPADGHVVDLACGTGVVATWLALRHPERAVYASDHSSIAVASARATADANGVGDRVEVVRDEGLGALPDASAAFIALNPPFHSGPAVHTGLATPLFLDAARALRPGGELWTVWNSALQYRGELERLVGPTRQVARNRKFTVTVSTRR
ncbi:methyltransferase [Microbacterium sp. NPDC089189]|uniref:class I SAM-dependent methyltransferase n=1 Tax=Microbacterium sp. NPDC089189 TaxID=3154972 RepID=UPI00342366C1